MAITIETSNSQIGFQLSLLNLTASTAESAGPSVVSTPAKTWKEGARKIENLIEQHDEQFVLVNLHRKH